MKIPTPPQLDEHPEDGVLALIDGALLLAVRSLVAVHPDIDASNTGRSNLGFGYNDRPDTTGDPELPPDERTEERR